MIVVATLFSTAAYAAEWPADGTGNAGASRGLNNAGASAGLNNAGASAGLNNAGASAGLNNAIGEGRNSNMVCVNGRCFTRSRR
jgi:hypothetical protein